MNVITESQLYAMKLHEAVIIDIKIKNGPSVTYLITRVVTGWLYRTFGANDSGAEVFVPLTVPTSPLV